MLSEHYPLNRIGQREVIALPVSFESGETGTFKLPTMPYRMKLVAVRSAVTKALAASNDGTITIKKGSTTYATVTVAASAAIGDEDSAPSVTETAFETDEQISIVTAKSSAGGKAMLYLTFEYLPSHI